jgi:FtsZ-interacting cell division protein YlmF
MQRVKDKVPRTIVKLPRRTQTGVLQVVFRIPYTYDFVTELCRQQAEAENVNFRNIGQNEAQNRKFKRLKFDGGQEYSRSSF